MGASPTRSVLPDGVIGNTPVSEAGFLGSNPSRAVESSRSVDSQVKSRNQPAG